MSSRGLDLLKEEESRLKQELSEIRADIAKLEGSKTGRPKAKKEFNGISDRIARLVAEEIRGQQGKGIAASELIERLDGQVSPSAVRSGANKAVSIFDDIIRYKEIDGRVFHYKAKQATTEATE